MNILFDHQIFSTQTFGGISRYYTELYKRLNMFENVCANISVKYSINHYIYKEGIKLDPSIDNLFDKLNIRGRGRTKMYANELHTLKSIKMSELDVFHPTYYDPYFLKYLDNVPYVVTAYDMIHERFPFYFPKNDSTTEYKKIIFKKANRIIAISDNTKKDLIELFQISQDKIDVIHLGSSINLIQVNNQIPPVFQKKFLLYVGERRAYKNFTKMVKAMSKTLRQEEDLYLYCFGGGKFSPDEINLIDKENIKDKIIHFQGDDSILKMLYQQAIAFVFPSIYEGFGIPILESMMCGCPVILSNSSSLSEVAADAAQYFDPNDEESIISAVNAVLYQERFRKELIDKGFVRARNFSWEATATKTLNTYQMAINK